MKRFLLSSLSVFVVAAMIGLTGCDSGGIEPGAPEGVTPASGKLPIDANAATGPKEGAKKPEADPAVPAPEKGKDAPKG
jgi:hypothetical protein